MPAIQPYREKPPRLPKKITCERCGTEFLMGAYGKGKTKYCIECKVDVMEEHLEKRKLTRKQRSMEETKSA